LDIPVKYLTFIVYCLNDKKGLLDHRIRDIIFLNFTLPTAGHKGMRF